MNEYVNKATNDKVIAVQWTGKPNSTIQVNPNSLLKYNSDYDRSEYLPFPQKTLDIMRNKFLKGNSGAYVHVAVKAHVNDYIVVKAKDILHHTLIDLGDSCRTEIVKPNAFKKWYKKVSPKSSKHLYIVKVSHSNNMFNVPDPVKVIGGSENLSNAYKKAVKKEWDSGGAWIQSISNCN